MKRSVNYYMFLLLCLILGLTLNTGVAYAQKPNQSIEVDMGIMDDFGNILEDYTKEFFMINDDHFIYRTPPVIDRYTFATANVLKLVTGTAVSYRVNYFYTLDSTEAGAVPEPLLMSEMPMKKVTVEKFKVIVSVTDESMREIADTKIMTLDYFWDTFKIPVPKHLNGYGFQRLETGKKIVNGKSLPQLVYVYKRGGEDLREPSLIFAHLFGEKAVSTIKPEYLPPESTSPATSSASKPATKPGTKPETKPDTKPGTKPDKKPETKPETKPDTKPDNDQGPVKTDSGSSLPQTKPVATNALPASTTTNAQTGIITQPGSNPPGSVDQSAGNRNGIVFGTALLGIAIAAAGYIYSRSKK